MSEDSVTNTEAVERYFENIRARNLEGLLRLFSARSTMILPDGRAFAGLDAIRQMYTGLFAAQPPAPRPVGMIAGMNSVATEIEAQLPGGVRRTANFFYFDAQGLIERISVYAAADAHYCP